MTEEEVRRRFESTFRSTYGAMFSYAVARTDPDTAKDAIAAAYLVAWRRRSDLPDQPLPWLLGILRKTLSNQRRTFARSANLAERLSADPGASREIANPMDDDPGDELVLAALDELRPSDQELLRLVSWDGLSNEEIAVVLRLPRRVVALRLHRARKRFRAALEAITPSRETDASLLVRPPIVPIHLEQS